MYATRLIFFFHGLPSMYMAVCRNDDAAVTKRPSKFVLIATTMHKTIKSKKLSVAGANKEREGGGWHRRLDFLFARRLFYIGSHFGAR